MRKFLIVAGAVAALAILPAAAEARTCGHTTHGWRILANSVTTCQFAFATTNRMHALEVRRNLYVGRSYYVWPYSRALGDWVRMRCYIVTSLRTACYGGEGAFVGIFA